MKIQFLKLQKNILKVATFFALVFLLFNCSKDEDPAPIAPTISEQNPLPGFLTLTGLDQKKTDEINSASNVEFGLNFSPNVDGKITAIVVKLPVANPTLRVTIWDKVTGTKIRTETVDIATANVEVVKTIEAIPLLKDKEYVISYNTNDRYIRKRSDDAAISYGVVVGDIFIKSFSYRNSSVATITAPIPITNYYAGDCSFKFQK